MLVYASALEDALNWHSNCRQWWIWNLNYGAARSIQLVAATLRVEGEFGRCLTRMATKGLLFVRSAWAVASRQMTRSDKLKVAHEKSRQSAGVVELAANPRKQFTKLMSRSATPAAFAGVLYSPSVAGRQP